MNKTETTPDNSTIEQLDFEPSCEIRWVRQEGLDQCENVGKHYAEVFSHRTHHFVYKVICDECLDELLRQRTLGTWCLECNAENRIRSYRPI